MRSFWLLGAILVSVASVGVVQAAPINLVFSFQNPLQGQMPTSVIGDEQGNFYGTTLQGGGSGKGVVFKIVPDGSEQILTDFPGKNIYQPNTPLVRDAAGNLYGTARCGTTGCSNEDIIFKIAPDGRFSILHRFSMQDAAGYYTWSHLTLDAQGNLYGTTMSGLVNANDQAPCSTTGCGAVFKLAPNGSMTVLHRFEHATGFDKSGGFVLFGGGLLPGDNSEFYGTTDSGGPGGYGVVFKISADGSFSVLHSFGDGSGEAQNPSSNLVRDGNGNLFGTTAYGGDYRYGALFKVKANGAYTLVHSFGGDVKGLLDGQNPEGMLAISKTGDIVGTSPFGGNGNGVVFKVSPKGHEKILWTFAVTGHDARYGIIPDGGVWIDAQGNLYGTTLDSGGPKKHHGTGTVFSLRP